MTKNFDGEGFSQDPIKGEEAAKHRHMYKEVSEEWIPIAAGVTLMRGIVIFGNVLKVAGPIGVFSLGAGAYAKSQGWL